MSLLGVLGSSAGVVIVAVISWLGARRLQGSTVDKNAVDGFDLLTGRLEARLAATEKRLAEVEVENASLRAERDDLRRRVEHAEAEAASCRAEVDRLTARVTALIEGRP